MAWIPLPPFPYWWALRYYRAYASGGWNELIFLFNLILLSAGGFLLGAIITKKLYDKSRKAFQVAGIVSVIGGIWGLATVANAF